MKTKKVFLKIEDTAKVFEKEGNKYRISSTEFMNGSLFVKHDMNNDTVLVVCELIVPE